ncbi:sulfotransferase [Acetobacter sacchari]|uniref:Sulfotransferase n=1 Tax=Acetobacter sacchari TaxID=2661687 RepID=A0ABS3LWJ2_9PROT|nr:Stf0 family sulfotransferase [Acetobacter sacchari]MBO1360276.1 sulfotransferase [Acetobacter sacchari]
MFKAYIICTTPRSGSTLLCKLLASAGTAGNPDSFYHKPQFMAEWATDWGISTDEGGSPEAFDRKYLAAAILAGRAGTEVFGMRLQYKYLNIVTKMLGQIFPGVASDASRFSRAFGDPLYIHLSRTDKVAQAVSLVRAEQSGLWHLNADGTDYERVSATGEVTYDFSRIHREVTTLAREDTAWSEWFAGQKIQPYGLSYETLADHPIDALQSVCRALGTTSPDVAYIIPELSKLSDSTNDEWIRRYKFDLDKLKVS